MRAIRWMRLAGKSSAKWKFDTLWRFIIDVIRLCASRTSDLDFKFALQLVNIIADDLSGRVQWANSIYRPVCSPSTPPDRMIAWWKRKWNQRKWLSSDASISIENLERRWVNIADAISGHSSQMAVWPDAPERVCWSDFLRHLKNEKPFQAIYFQFPN